MNRSEISSAWNFFYEKSDVRIRDKWLMGSPYGLALAYSCYVIFIVKLLPKFMENRRPLNYRKAMTFVDVLLWIRSCYFLYYSSYLHFFVYNWKCQPLDRSSSWLSNTEIKMSYQFVITKFLYILQSVVLVACKRNNSVAKYILIHHATFPFILWIGANFYPGGHAFFIGLVNSFVHLCVTSMRIFSTFSHNKEFVRIAKKVDVLLHVSFDRKKKYFHGKLKNRHFFRFFNLPLLSVMEFYCYFSRVVMSRKGLHTMKSHQLCILQLFINALCCNQKRQ